MAEDPMEAPGAHSIAHLPEELVAAAIALTTPRDAARVAAASQGFRAVADSDAVWSRFLPRDLPLLAPPAEPSDKARFLRLSDPNRPALLADGLMSVWLDRESGAKCYILSARALHITWGDTPEYWRWIPLPASCRFPEAAELLMVCWLLICGRMPSNMLSRNTTYAVYMVFKITDDSYGLHSPLQEASVSIGERTSTRKVCIHPSLLRPPLEDNVVLPQERAGDWMELEMGEFYNEQGDDGEVAIRLDGTKGRNWKRGLIVQGIEIRTKK